MKRLALILLLTGMAAAADAANVIVVTNNIYDLNPVRDAESVTAGQQTRITLYATDGVDPIDLSGGQNRLVVYDVRDNWELRSTGPAVTADADEGKLIWRIQALDAGSYKVEGTSEYANTNNNFDIFDIFLTVTNAPAAVPILNVGSTSVTNIFNEGAFSNTFQTVLTNNFAPTFSPSTTITNIIQSSLNIYYSSNIVASVTNEP
jgi:hypothetical protein